jgi:DNA-binding CsgD family transcriptional regulator
LRLASLLGDAFAVIDLATVTGRRATDLVAELRDAIRAGLLADHGGTLAFRHQLVREAIYEDIPQAARFALHREAGRALESAGAPLVQVASQLILGALPGDVEAARSLRRAAQDAVLRAPGVACELLRRAETLLPDGHPERDVTLAELVEALFRAGQVTQAAGIAEQVLARSHDAGVDGPLRFGLIVALSLQGRTAELNRQVDVALSRSPDMPFAEQARILAHSSYGQTFLGDLVGGEAVARRALDLAERSGDAATIVWTLGAMATAVRTRGRHPEALELTDRAVRLARANPDDFARMGNPHFIRGMTLCEADLMDEARLVFRDAATESERPEQAWVLPDVQLAWTELRFLIGQWEEAALELEGGIEFARERGNLNLLSKARGYLALIAVARGDRTAAESALATAEARSALRQPGPFGAVVAYAAAMLAESAGQPDVALEQLLPAWRDQVDSDNRHYERLLAPALVRLALTLDQPALALDVTDRAEQGAALAPSVPSVQGAAQRCRGLIERDPEMMLRAVEHAADSRRALDHAGSLEDAAKILALCQRAAEARALLAQAIDRYEAIGARSFAARAGASFRELGGRRGSRGSRRRALSGWESLTTSERAVAELVGEGLTNRAIARHLFTSPHTVNTHLRHAFQKLDVSNRAGLATRVSRERSR